MQRGMPVGAGLVLVILAGCGGDAGAGGSEVVERDSLGIRIVENHAPDFAAAWAVDSLGPILPPDGAVNPLPWGVSADPTVGRLYVLDARSQRVLVFDRDGEYLRSLGREGQGPGAPPAAEADTMLPLDKDPPGMHRNSTYR